MRRALLFCAAIVFAVACGDNITEPLPARTVTPPVSLATSTSGGGLSITTDKDDYAPGDTVHFTGTGWQAGDSLDIVLVDDALTQETHTWAVGIAEDGTFHDSTYVVDTDDIGVTFTLTATSRATGRSLTVVFTDGNFKYSTTPNNLVATIAFQKRSGTTCGVGTLEASGTFSNNSNSTIVTGSHYDITVPSVTGYTYNGYTSSGNVTISPASSPSNNVLCIVTSANNGSGSIDLAYLDNTTTELGHSPAATNVGQQVTFTATVKDHNGDPIGNKGSVTFYEFTGVQTCDALGSAAALAGPINLTNSPSGQASFQTSTLAAGTHTITGCYSGTTAFKKSFGSVSHTVSAVAVATNTGVTTSQTPTGFGESVTFTATVTSGSPATAVTTGSVTFKEGATCAAGTELQAAQAVNSSGQVTFTTTTLPIGSHTIRGCYGGATGSLASEGSVVQQVNNTATDLNVVSSINPSLTGQSSTFTATVTNNSNPVTSGQVAFKTGGTNCSDATQVQAPQTPNSSGIVTYSASFAASQSPITVRACYGGSTTPLLAASEATVSQVVNKAGTSTAVTTTKTPTVFSEPVTFAVTVSVVSPGTGTPAGNVTLRDGTCAAGTVLGGPTALNGSGQVSFSGISSLAVGSHTVRACYAGNDDFSESNGAVSQTVNKAATTTDLTSNANPSVFSQSVTFTATVSSTAPATAPAAGSVNFEEGGTACGTGTTVLATETLNGSGVATFSSSTMAVGSHTIRACYAGNSNFESSDDDLTQTVNKASTTTALTSNHNPSVFSQEVTFTATVSPVGPATATPTGDVTFEEGGTACGTGTTVLATKSLVSGQAAFSTLDLAVGSYTIRACYAETGNFKESGNSVNQVVNRASTTTALTSSSNPSVFSEPVDLKVTVQVVSPGTATPVGDVTLRDGTCLAGTILGGPTALDATGKVSFNISTLSIGVHNLSACYAGNSNFDGSVGGLEQTVNKASTQTALTSSANPSVYSEPVALHVEVTVVAPGTATPAGDVTLRDGTCLAGTILGGPTALDINGKVSFNVSTLSVGSHTVTACYAGNTNFESSENNVLQTVNKASTTTAVVSSVNPSLLNQLVTFSVTVAKVSPATATPAGDVTLKDGSCASGSTLGGPTPLGGSGQVSFNISTLAIGSHTVTACYAGNTNFEGSDGFVSQQVRYNFSGFFTPVDRPNVLNLSKAGQAIPLKWRLTDANGVPITDLIGVTVRAVDLVCSIGTTVDQIEEYAAGSSGLLNLGDGYYQFNWKTPTTYAGSCKSISLVFGAGALSYIEGPRAFFTFKR